MIVKYMNCLLHLLSYLVIKVLVLGILPIAR